MGDERMTDDKTVTFTKEELSNILEKVREAAYRQAAICTVNKMLVLFDYPITKALRELEKYCRYLVKEYKLGGK
jgi:hypothetical protein